MIAALIALAVLAGVVFNMRTNDLTTIAPAPQTTGQSSQAPGGSPAITSRREQQ
jgi:hypothetical protein